VFLLKQSGIPFFGICAVDFIHDLLRELHSFELSFDFGHFHGFIRSKEFPVAQPYLVGMLGYFRRLLQSLGHNVRCASPQIRPIDQPILVFNKEVMYPLPIRNSLVLQVSEAGLPQVDPEQRGLALVQQVTALDFPDTGAELGPAGEITPP
jgi:hypothetical protein